MSKKKSLRYLDMEPYHLTGVRAFFEESKALSQIRGISALWQEQTEGVRAALSAINSANAFNQQFSGITSALSSYQAALDSLRFPTEGIRAMLSSYQNSVAAIGYPSIDAHSAVSAIQSHIDIFQNLVGKIHSIYSPITEYSKHLDGIFDKSFASLLKTQSSITDVISGMDLSAFSILSEALPNNIFEQDWFENLTANDISEIYENEDFAEDIAEELREIIEKKDFSVDKNWSVEKKAKWYTALRYLCVIIMFLASPVVDYTKDKALDTFGITEFWNETGVYEYIDAFFDSFNKKAVTEEEAKGTVDTTKTGNISKQKREDLLAKIKEIRTFISAAPQDDNTSNLLSYLSELENDVNSKKYGLVFEEHREEIDEVLDTHTPVLTEDEKLFINNGGQMNFVIEGDNLASLKLLEKTHKSKIDLIYIDPPYNTGHNDFTYNDTFVDYEDSFKHSKWISFMSERLSVAKKLLSNDGAIFIQIDDNEQAPLKLLCDDVFGADNFMGIIIQNKMNAKNDTVNIQKNHEYILAYRKKTLYINGTRVKPTLLQIKEKYRPAVKEGERYYYIGDAITTRGEGGTLNARPNLGYTIYYNPDTDNKIAVADYDVELARTSNSIEEIYSHDESLIEKGYIPILPPKVRGKLGCWTWALEKFNNETDNIIITGKRSNFSVKKRTFVPAESIVEQNGQLFYVSIEQSNSRSIVDYSTNDGTNVLTDVMGVRATFSNPKNLDLIEYLVSLKQGKSNIILDFFAGSGTTGHAVMKLNAEDGGNRKFILCTNNHNSICRDVTYERIKRVIDKEGYEASLKYYKVDYIPVSERMYYEYADELLCHIRELVELENGVDFINNSEIAIVLTDEELEDFIANIEEFSKCNKLYMGHDILPDEEQEQALSTHEIEVNIIPDYYYKDLQEG